MSKRVQIVLLCEDRQHEVFARRFLKYVGWSGQQYIVMATPGKGSAEAFVREHFPEELKAYRANLGKVDQALLVVVDGDARGVQARLAQLEEACRDAGISPRARKERVAVFVPTRRIETWLAYLDGNSVDEKQQDYPRLDRESDCQKHVEELATMCRAGQLRKPTPHSLVAACEEYNTRFADPSA